MNESQREQTRRDAEQEIERRRGNVLALPCLAILSELEQAERDRDEWRNAAAKTQQDLVVALEELRVREESQIPVIPRAAHERLLIAEARLAKVPALVEALRKIAEGGLGDEPWLANYDRIREVAREALAAYEQEQA